MTKNNMQDLLIEQLKNIKIDPRTEWKNSTRDFLMSEIGDKHQLKIKMSLKSWVDNLKLVKLAWRPVGVFALVFMFFMGSSGLIIAAAQNSTPGTKMFIVKRIIEKGQGLIAADSSQKVELAGALLGNRVNELQKVIVQESQLVSANNINSSKKVVLAVKEVSKQLAEVNNELTQLKTENINDKKTAVAALILNDKIRSYQGELKHIKNKINDTKVNESLTKVLDKAGEINSNVLEVIVTKQQQGNLEIDDKEIGNKLAEHVSDIESKVTEIEEILANNVEVGDVNFKERTDKAKKKIEDARTAIDKNEFNLVLTLAKDSNSILKLLYGDIYEVIENKKIVEQDDVVNEGEVKGETDKKDVIAKQEDVNGIDKESVGPDNQEEAENIEVIIKENIDKGDIQSTVKETPEEVVEEFGVGIK